MAQAQGIDPDPILSYSSGASALDSEVDLLRWNYEKDLELVLSKLSKSDTSIGEKQKLREAIHSFLQTKSIGNGEQQIVQVQIQTETRQEMGHTANSVNELTDPPPPLTQRLIKRIICLMMQFQKQFSDVESFSIRKLGNDGEINPAFSNKNSDEEPRLSGVSSGDVTAVLSAFQDFFNDRLRSCVETNPFHISLVLTKICGYLQPMDLHTLRLVSQACNNEANSFHRKIHKAISLNKNKDLFFKDLMKTKNTFPFASFILDLEGLTSANITDFLNLSSVFRYLEITGALEVTPVQVNEIRLKLYFLFLNVRTVETLALGYFHADIMSGCVFPAQPVEVNHLKFSWDLRKKKTGVDFLKDLLSRLKNLRILTLILSIPSDWEQLDEGYVSPIEAMNAASPIEDALTHVHLHTLIICQKTIAYIPAMLLAKFQSQKLQTLDVTLDAEDEAEAEMYKQFFQTQSKTLQNLSLKTVSTGTVEFELPIMQNLTRADFTHLVLGDQVDCQPVLSLVQPRSLPLLRILRVCLDCIGDHLEESEFPTVQELEVKRRGWSPGFLVNLRRCGTMFPNLKKFKNEMSGIGVDELHVVFSALSHVEELELLITEKDTSDINLVLSGFPSESAWLVNELMASPDFLALSPPQPSLLNMTRLTKLCLEFKMDGKPSIFISDIGVQLAFLRMQRLSRLTLSGDFSISEANVLKLTEHHANVFFLHSQ